MTCEPTEQQLAEIYDKVMTKYPKLQTERTCMTEFRMRQAARKAYREKLMNELSRAQAEMEGVASKTVNL
jgi:hypothetical protein